jgi:uncharacterized protein (TIGR00661 family)
LFLLPTDSYYFGKNKETNNITFVFMNSKKRILVAPLNWGLGHATRCIPIVHALIEHNFEPILASDGGPLKLLKKEFPKLIHLELPSYNIEYPTSGQSLKLKFLKNIPRLLNAIKAEKEAVQNIIETYHIDGMISDNRFGVYNKSVPSVYITHQLRVFSGSTTWLSTKLHHYIIKKFDVCWIPDAEGKPNFSGRLGHIKQAPIPLKYIGTISRLKKAELPIIYDLMVLLSGPEPQRALLEQKLILELKAFNGKILFVKGIVEEQQIKTVKNQFTIYNFMQSQEIESAINQSELIIARSGYTTIMDLAILNKKAFFIPTPGQFEQEYLAQQLKEKQLAPYYKQNEFCIENLEESLNFKGLNYSKNNVDFQVLFSLF